MPPPTGILLNEFPFSELYTAEYLNLYAIGNPRIRSPTIGGCMLGNYAAACVLRGLRTKSKAQGYHDPSLDLHVIMELPTDLLFEIFQHLHPIDLYTLVRTTKSFRYLLLSKESYSIWRSSYANHQDIPYCPSDVSFPRWTTLLFGPDECHKCGAIYAMPDIAFRANYCESCIMRNYMDKAVYPHLLESHPLHKDCLWDLLPYSYQWSGYTYFKGEFRRQYLSDDITRREQETMSFLERIDADIPGARREFKIFWLNTAADIKRYMNHVEMCNSWFMETHGKVKVAHFQLSLKLARKCSRILTKRGFDSRDINISIVQNALHASHITRIRGLRFRSVLKRIEIWAADAAKARHVDEKKDLLQKRQKLVDDMYHKFANSRFTTDMWSSLPPADVIRELDYFKDFINSETEEVGELSEERSIDQLNAFIETSFEKPKRALTFASLLTTGKMKDYLGNGHEREFDVLELATSIFSCPPCEAEAKAPSEASAVVGWSELKNHLYCTTSKEKTSVPQDKKGKSRLEIPLRADKGGTKDAVSLLKMLGLDPSTTTAEHLDILNPRFLCLCCPREVSKGVAGRKAMSWRECLAHLHHSKLVTSQGTHYVPSWTLLTEEAARSVRYHEQLSNPSPRKSSWSCMHCSAHFQHGVRRNNAIGHLRTEHKIERPKQDVDFVSVPEKNPPRKMFVVTLEPSTNFRCLKCPEPKSLRLWSLRSLLAHLSDKHGIKGDFESAYTSIPLAQKTSDESIGIGSSPNLVDSHLVPF